jgi:CRP/FNR family transcriptional regulator
MEDSYEGARERITAALRCVSDALAPQRRVVHAGELICEAGEPFDNVYVLNSGFYKVVTLSADGREQIVGLKFRGDWLGFDGIASGRYACDVVALDTGEVWVVRYDQLMAAGATQSELLSLVHDAMSREMTRDRDSLTLVCTFPADARVAAFLMRWGEALARQGMRQDQLTLCMTRAEIGNYLGLTLESVSRALTRLARAGLIGFAEKRRRELHIPDVTVLSRFVRGSLAPASTILQ